ncbi:MAG TPA: patatin-like protein [Gaiellaceae bacterium]
MRFAVVLYGGVSLAIYINGVVQELLRLVRASAPTNTYPENPWGQPVYFPTSAPDGGRQPLKGSEKVYRRLAQLLPLGDEGQPAGDVPEDAPVRTRFVVDILSGSSAGGINGIFLAKALANQQQIDDLRDLWVDEGDIAILLNDKASYAGLADTVERQTPPRSLLNGQRLYTRALNALRAMRDTTERPEDQKSPSYAEQIDLFVTTTDLQGLRVPIALHDRVVYENRHRHVFHFVYGTPEATGSFRNDFVEGNDGMLAFAARATSSFPFAFEPVTLVDTKQVDASLEPLYPGWGRFFDEHASRGADYRNYAFADGGYLDNKPFTHATSALRRRRADVPVERKLIYVEPDPGGRPTKLGKGPLPADPPAPRPDVIDNVAAAAMALPRAEPIRDDIQAVLDRNQTLEQLRRITLRVELDFMAGRDPFGPIRELAPDRPDEVLDELLRDCAVFHRAYRRLRAATVADELASMIAAVAGVRQESDTYRALTLVIRVWIDDRHAESLNAFLNDFDFGYRLRRLRFLQDRINDLLRRGPRSRQMLEMYPTMVPEGAKAEWIDLADVEPDLLGLKLALNDVFVELRRRGRAVRQGEGSGEEQREIGLIRQSVAALAEDVAGLHATLETDAPDREHRVTDQARNARAYIESHDGVLTTLEHSLGSFLRRTFADTEAATEAVLGDGIPRSGAVDVRLLIRGYYLRFDSFDAISLPLHHPDLGETSPVDIVRISPQDATSIIDETAPGSTRTKLAGNALGHFGGFLDESWRRNDVLWGRLDGADRILASVLPEGALRDELREQAQGAILREELLEVDRGKLTDLLAGALLRQDVPDGPFAEDAVAGLRNGGTTERTAMMAALRALPDGVLIAHLRDTYEVPRALDPQAMLSVGGRAMDITGRVLEDVSKRRSVPAKPWFWGSRLGRLAWGIAEVAMPRPARTIPGLLFRYWSQLAILVAAVLILFGVLGAEGAQKVGWILLGIVLGIRTVVWLAEAFMAPPETETPPTHVERRVTDAAAWAARVAVWAGLAGLVLVIAGVFYEPLAEIGWWVVTAGILGVVLAFVVGVAVASPRRLVALGFAVLVIGVVALAALEVGRHARGDIEAAAEVLPGNRTDGFEQTMRDGAEDVWDKLWPW